MTEHILMVISVALAIAAFCQWLAWRINIPAIVFLLCSGILGGPILGFFSPETLFGDLFFPFVSISVALILFEGSLTLKFEEIRGLEKVVRNMVSYGMVITWAITAVAARYGIGLSWHISILFGAITSVSGPTVIVPMLRVVRPTRSVSNILRWEGIIIDPIGATMAVLVYEFIIIGAGQDALGHTLVVFLRLIGIGTAIGAIFGYFSGLMIRHHLLPKFLHNLFVLMLVIVSFTLSNILQSESGLIAVTVMGIWMANMKDVPIEEILDFKENISMLLISLLFIMLAARLNINALMSMGWGLLILFIAVQFLARPMNVMVSCLGSRLTWPERNLLAWIAPRGIVAAAIAALFSVQLEKAGYADASSIVPLTFFIIIATVVLQSLTARPIARWLKVAEPEPRGFLIIGANAVSRAVARALIDNGINVLLADAGRENVSKARLDGLPAYFGNPISEHAERYMDMAGIGKILAMSPHDDINAACAMHFRMETGPENIFVLQTKKQDDSIDRKQPAAHRQAKMLFGSKVTFAQIASALANGGEIKTTGLTDKFDFNTFTQKHEQNAVPLFALDPKQVIYTYSQNYSIRPEPGWSVIYLLPAIENKKKALVV